MPKDWSIPNKERKLFQRKSKEADYRLIIDFEKFKNGDDRTRELLLLKNILAAVEDLDKKAKKSFDGEALKSDILNLFSYTAEDVSNV